MGGKAFFCKVAKRRLWKGKVRKERPDVLINTNLLSCFRIQVRDLEGLPQWVSGGICMQCSRHRFDPWFSKISWRRNVNPLHHSCLGDPINRGAWWATVHGVAKSQRWLSDSTKSKHMSLENTYAFLDRHIFNFHNCANTFFFSKLARWQCKMVVVTMESSLAVRITVWSRYTTPGFIPPRIESKDLNKSLSTSIYSSTMHTS